MKKQERKNPNFWIAIVFRAVLIGCILWSLWMQQRSDAANVLVTFALTYIPYWTEKIFKIGIVGWMKNLFLVFIVMANLFGQFFDVYGREIWGMYPWDTIVHFISGILFGLIGFLLFFMISNNLQKHMQISLWIPALFAFFFCVACGTFWEFFEFVSNMVGVPMGGDIVDTISDLVADSFGGLLAVIGGFVSLKKGKLGFFQNIFWRADGKKVDIEVY